MQYICASFFSNSSDIVRLDEECIKCSATVSSNCFTSCGMFFDYNNFILIFTNLYMAS